MLMTQKDYERLTNLIREVVKDELSKRETEAKQSQKQIHKKTTTKEVAQDMPNCRGHKAPKRNGGKGK